MPINYPDLSDLSSNATIVDLMALPNSSYPFYWGVIIMGLWAIISFTLYFKDKALSGKSNLLSAMAVSSLAMIVLSTILTLTPILTMQIFLPLLIGGLLIIAIWIFSS